MDPVMLIFLVVIFGMLFLMMSRNRKQQRQTTEMRQSLAVGDEVMTSSGMYGTVTALEGNVVTIESVPGQPTRWFLHAIGKKVDPATEYATGEEPSEELESGTGSADDSSSAPDGFLSEEQMRRPYRDDKKD